MKLEFYGSNLKKRLFVTMSGLASSKILFFNSVNQLGRPVFSSGQLQADMMMMMAASSLT